MTIDPKVLSELPAEPLEAVVPRLRDGDLLLCSAHDPFSRLIAWSTKSPWTHVAFAWRWPQTGRILAFECVQHIGVRAVGMEQFLSETSSGMKPYPGKIVLARDARIAALADPTSLIDEAVDLIGSQFSAAEIVKIGLRIALGRFDRHTPKPLKPTHEFICSEYVNRCFRRVGAAFHFNGRGFISPADIASDEHVSAVARFQTR